MNEIDTVIAQLVNYYEKKGAQIIILSEYGIGEVNNPIHLNRLLRENGLLQIRIERGLELLDPGASKAFVVADHQVAHVYINDASVTSKVKNLLEKVAGIELIFDKSGQQSFHINHERSGDLVLMADAQSWFTYYFWTDDEVAPDYARVVDIHKKPGYDPVEMFMTSKLRAAYKLLRKKAGFRYVMDVIPLDAMLVKGSHGRVGTPDELHAVIITSNPLNKNISPTDVHQVIWNHLH